MIYNNDNDNGHNNYGIVQPDFTKFGDDWVMKCTKSGLNASQCANLGQDFFKNYPNPGTSRLPKNYQGVIRKWKKCYLVAREKIKNGIDMNDCYTLILDETPDRWDDLDVTTVLYANSPKRKPKTVDIQMMESNVDNESIKKAVFDTRDYYLFRRDNCSAFALDSVSYNQNAFIQLKCSFRYIVAILDPIHPIATGLKNGHGVNGFKEVVKYYRQSYSLFSKSLARKKHLKDFYKYECTPVDDHNDLENILQHLLRSDVEDILEEKVELDDPNDDPHDDPQDNSRNIEKREKIYKVLTKSISYNSYPPKLILEKFKSAAYCSLYAVHRFWDFFKFIKQENLPADNYLKNMCNEESMQRDIYLKILWSNREIMNSIYTIYWFEKRGYQSHVAFDVLTDLKEHYNKVLTSEDIQHDDLLSGLFQKWSYDEDDIDDFVFDCQDFVYAIYSHYKGIFDSNSNPTMAFFEAARYFNISKDRSGYPKDVKIAFPKEAIPWGPAKYAALRHKERQLQAEWTAYLAEAIPQYDDDDELNRLFHSINNGDMVYDYWKNKVQQWPLLAPIAVRTLDVVCNTADVERIFSVYNFMARKLDAVNLTPEHKKHKAFVQQNKGHL